MKMRFTWVTVFLQLGCGQGSDEPSPAPIDCPEGSQARRSQDRWSLSEDPDEIAGMAEAWPFPPAGTADTWTCQGTGGVAVGPYLSIVGASRVTGQYDPSGLATGTWRGTWSGEDLAFEGRYEAGQRAGGWRFLNPKGRQVANGVFKRGKPHGDWMIRGAARLTDIRYVYGVAHGRYREVLPDGSEVQGHYFNGTKNYEWDFLAIPEDGGPKELVKQEAWKYDTFVVEWDPRTDPNPLPTFDLPGSPLTPEGDGLCKVHSRCASNAYLTVMLAGGALDPEAVYDVPLLVDFVDPEAAQPARDRIVLVDNYILGEAVIGPDEKSATVSAEITTRCEVSGPDAPIVPRPGTETIELEVAEQDDVWKLVRPLPVIYTRLDVYLERVRQTDPAYAERIRAECMNVR